MLLEMMSMDKKMIMEIKHKVSREKTRQIMISCEINHHLKIKYKLKYYIFHLVN